MGKQALIPSRPFVRLVTQAGMLTLAMLACGCSTLSTPAEDEAAMMEATAPAAPRFENAKGPVSAGKGAAILANLKRQSGDVDLLEKQITLEQAVVGSPLVIGNKVTLLQDGAATYSAMFAAIRAARDHINVESYIFEDDELGQAFADLLLEQQAKGVQVNLIYDSVGAINTPRAFFDRLATAGVAVLEFNPVNPFLGDAGWNLNNRDHRKLLIVDGRTAFLGGINISGVYSSGSIFRRKSKVDKNKAVGDQTPWRDTDIQLDGPVVAEFQKMFLATWDKQQGKPLAQRNYFPVIAEQGKDIVRAIGSSPDDPHRYMHWTLLSALGNAQQLVNITTAYFVPDPKLLKALVDAVQRGVDVTMILPGHTDSGLVFHAGRSHYTTLLQGGVKIYERHDTLMHAKTVSMDGVWSTVGSANLDWRSLHDNDEVNAVIVGREFAKTMDTMFARDLQASSQVTLEAWQDRPFVTRIKEWLARMWARWL